MPAQLSINDLPSGAIGLAAAGTRDRINSAAAHLLKTLTAIESLTINHELDFVLETPLEDSIEWTGQGSCASNGLCNPAPPAVAK